MERSIEEQLAAHTKWLCELQQELIELRRTLQAEYVSKSNEAERLAAALSDAESTLDSIECGQGGCEQRHCADLATEQRARRVDHSAILSSHDSRVRAETLKAAVSDVHLGEFYSDTWAAGWTTCYQQFKHIAARAERGEWPEKQ